MLTVNTYDVGPVAPVPVPGEWQPWGPHGARLHLLEMRLRLRWGACYGNSVAVTSGELAVLSEGGGSSLTPDLIICAITGWFCLSCMILVIAWMKASGASTNALASASGLSSTMAMSISAPSFLMRADLPACICSRIATALFSQRFRSHSSMALCASDPVVVGPFERWGS